MAVTLHTTILDMQPIDPPVGGGRLRLLGLYHGLGASADDAEAALRHTAHYVGTYDWRGPGLRQQQLTGVLHEELVPLSEEHFAASDRRTEALGGKNVIDTAFHTMAHLSPEYVEAARAAAASADVVVFSHPWIYPLVRDVLRPDRQLIVYDAHNVEGLLRTDLLDDGAGGSEVARGVVEVENAVCAAADLVLACSHDDASAFASLYGVPFERIRVIPNGTFTRKIKPPTDAEKREARGQFGVEDKPVAFFLGSNYGPNVEAARFIADALAPALPNVLFVIGGGVGDGLENAHTPANVRVTGRLSDAELLQWLKASDIAVNPMFGGSGTNIKMLDFMAAGLPIVTTAIGARGIDTSERAFVIAQAETFARTVSNVLGNAKESAQLAAGARSQADRFYSWERISDYLGTMLSRWAEIRKAGKQPPFFSVVVPTYERHELLSTLVNFLDKQKWRDFEVIIVDQSASPWPDRDKAFSFDLHYIHTDRKGAVTARNTGAGLARGKVIAFTDDDCEPDENWLAAAHEVFTTTDAVGLEGLIRSDRVGDSAWRPVTNEGFEGIGFMTANLFVRADIFHKLNGFDIALEKPHFREDTDLGWRLQDVGEVPFSREAWVYHPPHSREIERESQTVRSTFFQNDAILMRKHPERYAELMLREVQWQHVPDFWDHFLKGIELHGVEVPDDIRNIMRENAGIEFTGLLQAGGQSLPPAGSTGVSPALDAARRPAGLHRVLGRSLAWPMRSLWHQVWERIERRVRPVEQRLDGTSASLLQLQRSTDERLKKVEARLEAIERHLSIGGSKGLSGSGKAKLAETGNALDNERSQAVTDKDVAEILRAAALVMRSRARLEAVAKDPVANASSDPNKSSDR